MTDEDRPPYPPFTEEAAQMETRLAEDAWNTRDPERVSLAYTPDCHGRNQTEFVHGQSKSVAFLRRKWTMERGPRLIKELLGFQPHRLSTRFVYERLERRDQWLRTHGVERGEFNAKGLMSRRIASINDLAIAEGQRLSRWPAGPGPADHPGLSALSV